jgi:hypothetical protein
VPPPACWQRPGTAENMIDGTATVGEVVARMASKTKRGGGSALLQAAPSALARAEREVIIAELEL